MTKGTLQYILKVGIAILLPIGLFCGCASPPAFKMYAGSQRPAAETAVLVLDDDLSLKEADGTSIFNSRFNPGWNPRFYKDEDVRLRLELLPGEHAITVEFDAQSVPGNSVSGRPDAVGVSGEPITVHFTATAGHAYRVTCWSHTKSVWAVYVQDCATGEIVSKRTAN